VDAVLLTPGSEEVLIQGSGFPANSELTLDSDSEGERHGGKGKVDADGNYASVVLPYKLGIPWGILNVRLKSAACSPSIQVPWDAATKRRTASLT
jgi:hypothetical protein